MSDEIDPLTDNARRVDAERLGDSEPLLLDFEEARRILGLSRSTLYRHASRVPGSLKLGGTWRFNRKILLDFIGCKAPGSPPKKEGSG